MNHQSLATLIQEACANNVKEVFLLPGRPPCLRREDGLASTMSAVLSPDDTATVARALCGDEGIQRLAVRGFNRTRIPAPEGFDASATIARAQGGYTITIRLRQVDPNTLSLEALAVPTQLRAMIEHTHGLVLVTGPHGSGRSTTLYALAHHLASKPLHLCTVEDPIEHVLSANTGLVQQRQVGRDVPDATTGILAAMHQDVDVVVVFDLPDFDTLMAAVTAAETGHLVLVQVQGSSPVEALRRIIGAAPDDVRELFQTQLAAVLLGVSTQRLHSKPQGGLRAVYGILTATDALRNALRNGEDLTPVAEMRPALGAEVARLITSAQIVDPTVC